MHTQKMLKICTMHILRNQQIKKKLKQDNIIIPSSFFWDKINSIILYFKLVFKLGKNERITREKMTSFNPEFQYDYCCGRSKINFSDTRAQLFDIIIIIHDILFIYMHYAYLIPISLTHTSIYIKYHIDVYIKLN